MGTHKGEPIVEVDLVLTTTKVVSDKAIGIRQQVGSLRKLPSTESLEANGVSDWLHNEERRCTHSQRLKEPITQDGLVRFGTLGEA
jgi:hypothetical protein